MDPLTIAFAAWVVILAGVLFKEGWEFLTDLFVSVFDSVLKAMLTIIQALPNPCFIIESDWLAGLLSPLPSFSLFVIGKMHIPEAFGVLLCGFTFYLLRKAVTLGQW